VRFITRMTLPNSVRHYGWTDAHRNSEDDDAARHGGRSSNNPDLMSFHEGEFENVAHREIHNVSDRRERRPLIFPNTLFSFRPFPFRSKFPSESLSNSCLQSDVIHPSVKRAVSHEAAASRGGEERGIQRVPSMVFRREEEEETKGRVLYFDLALIFLLFLLNLLLKEDKRERVKNAL
jgi:hypothetical protein